MVDGVLASCYASADHDLGHLSMMPIRIFPKTMEWIFGEKTGFPFKVIEEVARLFLPYGQLFEPTKF